MKNRPQKNVGWTRNKLPAFYGRRYDYLITVLKTISTYTFPYEAQIAWAKLDSEQIPALIADEQAMNVQWLYSNALGGARLQVPEEYVESAI